MTPNAKTDSAGRQRRSLISRLRDCEDKESWREFFKTYWKLIYSFAIRCGCTDAEAEEVVQETVISLARKMPEYRYEPAVCSFKGWLMHVTNWRVIDQLRKRRTGKEMPLSLDASAANLIDQWPVPLLRTRDALGTGMAEERDRRCYGAGQAEGQRRALSDFLPALNQEPFPAQSTPACSKSMWLVFIWPSTASPRWCKRKLNL